MVFETTSIEVDSRLLDIIRFMSVKKNISQNQLIVDYLIKGLKADTNRELEYIHQLEKELNLKNEMNLDDIDFEIPEMLKYNPDKEEITDFEGLFNGDEETSCDLNSIIGIVKSPQIVEYTRD